MGRPQRFKEYRGRRFERMPKGCVSQDDDSFILPFDDGRAVGLMPLPQHGRSVGIHDPTVMPVLAPTAWLGMILGRVVNRNQAIVCTPERHTDRLPAVTSEVQRCDINQGGA